jgi:hypothetical protein
VTRLLPREEAARSVLVPKLVLAKAKAQVLRDARLISRARLLVERGALDLAVAPGHHLRVESAVRRSLSTPCQEGKANTDRH